MFKNIPNHETLQPDNTDLEIEDGMQKCEINHIYEVERKNKLLNPYILKPEKYNTNEELFTNFKNWWTKRYRKNPQTAHRYILNLQRMKNDNMFPCDFLEINPAQIIAHLDYHEKQNPETPWAIINKWKAVVALTKAMGINTEYWGYIPPRPPPAKVRIIPTPKTVHQLITHKYTKDKYLNHLIQYILYQGFGLGLRPEEHPILKTNDFYLNEQYIIITEPKKHGQRRQIFPEKELLTDPHRKSIYNWMKWRNKINPGNNNLWIQKNGNPYTTDYLRNILTEHVKPVWPHFNMYVMRHYCAIMRLIHSKAETGKWDTWEVKEWLGHDDEKTTKNYIRYADKYYRIAHYDWLKAMLKFHKKRYNGLLLENSRTPLLTPPTTPSNRRNQVWARPCSDLFYSVKKFKNYLNTQVLNLSTSLTKLFFSLFSKPMGVGS